METPQQRRLIRENYAIGKELGRSLLDSDKPREEIENEVARSLIISEGLDYNFQQGVWHTVSKTPLCYVRTRIGEKL